MMEQWMTNIGTFGLTIVALFVGFYLIGRALLDLKEGLGGKSKDFSKAGIGIVIGLVGGLIGWWGVNNILNFFKTNGQQIPKA